MILPQDNHSAEVIKLRERSQSSGQLTSDASLAVYAIENRATLCSNDADFGRVPGLDWKNPLLEASLGSEQLCRLSKIQNI